LDHKRNLTYAILCPRSHNPGSTVPPPHEKYIYVPSEADSPVQQTYMKSKDGL